MFMKRLILAAALTIAAAAPAAAAHLPSSSSFSQIQTEDASLVDALMAVIRKIGG
jgi:hypothetical protein